MAPVLTRLNFVSVISWPAGGGVGMKPDFARAAGGRFLYPSLANVRARVMGRSG